MSKKFCTVESIENYLSLEIATEFEAQVENWIESVSELVRLITNRDWLADSVATAKFFDGNGCQALEVSDFIGTATLRIGEDYGQQFVANTNFITHPYNSNVSNTIILKDDFFPKGIKNVEVTAKWGYAEDVPEDIKLATTILASAVVLAQTNQNGEVESEKIGNYNVKYKDDKHKDDSKMAMDILNQRRVLLI